MKKRIIYNLLFSISLIISPFVLNAMLEEYIINGQLINYEGIDLDDLSITAAKVLPTGQRTINVKINENGEFVIRGDRFKELNQIWFDVDELYYGELLVSEELGIILDVAQLTKSNVYMVGQGVEFSGADAQATVLTNEWTLYQQEQQKINAQSNNGANNLSIEEKFIRNNPNELTWIIEDKRLSDDFQQLFSNSIDIDIDWESLNEALAYSPRIMGNSSQDYYRMLSWVLEKAVLGSHIDEHKINLKENLKRLDPVTRDFVIMAALPDEIERQEDHLIDFIPYVTKSGVKEFMTELLDETKLKLEEINSTLAQATQLEGEFGFGKKHKEFGFGATTYVSDEKDLMSFLKMLQNSFQNKAIIIDLWATWCAPCIQDMKSSGPIKKELKSMPVEIVYVCTNSSTIEKWEKKIIETKTEGTHIYIDKKLTSAFLETFELQGYPSYLFFDNNGEFHENVIDRISTMDLAKIESYIK